MKCLVLLLVSLVIWLSVNPCCAAKTEEKSATCLLETPSSEPDGDDPSPCSPFYSCGACVGTVIEDDVPFQVLSIKQIPLPEKTEAELQIPQGNESLLLRPPKSSFFLSY